MKSGMKSADNKKQTYMFYYRSADNVLCLDVSYNVSNGLQPYEMWFGFIVILKRCPLKLSVRKPQICNVKRS